MKKLILTIAVGITASQVQAQISIAPEAGVNLSNASVSTNIFGNNPIDTKMKLGLKAGAVVDIPIVGGLFVQPGAFFLDERLQNFLIGNSTGYYYRIHRYQLPQLS